MEFCMQLYVKLWIYCVHLGELWNVFFVADPDPVRLKNVPPKLFRWKSVVTVLEREHTHCSEEAVDLEKICAD